MSINVDHQHAPDGPIRTVNEGDAPIENEQQQNPQPVVHQNQNDQAFQVRPVTNDLPEHDDESQPLLISEGGEENLQDEERGGAAPELSEGQQSSSYSSNREDQKTGGEISSKQMTEQQEYIQQHGKVVAKIQQTTRNPPTLKAKNANDKENSIEVSPLINQSKITADLPNEFFERHTWELWVIFLLKLISSLVFLIDDLTFLVFCEYEFKMAQSEAGLLFCISALFLFAYGLTVSGYLIDVLGVKYSLILGFTCISISKFTLTFADSLSQLYLVMCTISPFGISIVFPCLVLGVKKLTNDGPFRKLCFSIYFGFMVIGGVLGGPIVDYIRRDVGKTQFEYLHTNVETGKIEKRFMEISAWRSIQFFGFFLYILCIILLCTYRSKTEDLFNTRVSVSRDARLSCMQILQEVFVDFRFWRFLAFSFVIVGVKMVFSLLFFMLPKMITQEDGADAPFGLYISLAPILIIVFLIFLTPVHAKYNSYDLILIGSIITTVAPIPMFFGVSIMNFLFFIGIISIAEALYAPMINVFTFNFTREGREGTFLTLTAAPVYFTMALTGVVGGYLLENFYPAVDDSTHHHNPKVIWGTIIILSATSTTMLFMFQNYFNCSPEKNDGEVLITQNYEDILKVKYNNTEQALNLEDLVDDKYSSVIRKDGRFDFEREDSEIKTGPYSGSRGLNRSQTLTQREYKMQYRLPINEVQSVSSNSQKTLSNDFTIKHRE